MRTCKWRRNKRSGVDASTIQAELLPCTSAVVLVVEGQNLIGTVSSVSFDKAASTVRVPT